MYGGWHTQKDMSIFAFNTVVLMCFLYYLWVSRQHCCVDVISNLFGFAVILSRSLFHTWESPRCRGRLLGTILYLLKDVPDVCGCTAHEEISLEFEV